jgi:hypothetical protein
MLSQENKTQSFYESASGDNKPCNALSTYAIVVLMQLLDQEATSKYNASNRVREKFS